MISQSTYQEEFSLHKTNFLLPCLPAHSRVSNACTLGLHSQ